MRESWHGLKTVNNYLHARKRHCARANDKIAFPSRDTELLIRSSRLKSQTARRPSKLRNSDHPSVLDEGEEEWGGVKKTKNRKKTHTNASMQREEREREWIPNEREREREREREKRRLSFDLSFFFSSFETVPGVDQAECVVVTPGWSDRVRLCRSRARGRAIIESQLYLRTGNPVGTLRTNTDRLVSVSVEAERGVIESAG